MVVEPPLAVFEEGFLSGESPPSFLELESPSKESAGSDEQPATRPKTKSVEARIDVEFFISFFEPTLVNLSTPQQCTASADADSRSVQAQRSPPEDSARAITNRMPIF